MNTQLNKNASQLTVTTQAILPQTMYQLCCEFIRKYYPWGVIVFCSFFLFYKYVLQVSPSVMTEGLMTEFGIHGAGLGNLAATYFYAYLITQLFVGPLLDRFSPRYLTAFAIFICALGAFSFANTHSLTMAQVSRALMGAGTAFATVSYMKMTSIWFRPDKAAFADGLLASAAMLGALCGQVPLTLLVEQSGWRESLVYCGLFGLGFGALFILLVRDNNPSARHQAKPLTKKSSIKLVDIYAVLKDKRNWLLALYSGLVFTPITVLGGLWGNPFFEVSHQLSSTEAAYFTSLIFIGLALGSPLFGFFAGRFACSIKVMMIGTVLAFVALLPVIYWSSLPLWLLGVLLFLFGLGTGVFILGFSLAKALNQLALAATVVALINTGDALLGSFTEPVIGKVLDFVWDGATANHVHLFSTQNYQIALSMLPFYLFMAFICLCVLNKKS